LPSYSDSAIYSRSAGGVSKGALKRAHLLLVSSKPTSGLDDNSSSDDKVYQRLGITKVRVAAHRHRTSGLCERAIPSLLTMRTCHMSSEQHHSLVRLPPILWAMNTSVSASTGHSPFFLDHGRQPRDITSRAMDMADMPAISADWAKVMQDRLGLARRIQSAVETHAPDEQDHRVALPREPRRKPTTFKLGSFFYDQVQRDTRMAADGM
jgi:hypothetical protein